jgi:lactate permease
MANTVPVSFGAVGTPVRVGLGGLPQMEITQFLGVFGLFLSLIVPILLVGMIKREIRPHQGIVGSHGLSHGIEDGSSKPSSIVPFAVWAGAVFAIPYWLVSRFSTELPTLLGSLIGLSVTFAFSNFPWWRKLFLPRITQRLNTFDPNEVPLHPWRVVTPYIFMVVLLILGRLYLPAYQIGLPGEISHTLSLFNPGLIMLFLALWYALSHHLSRSEMVHTGKGIGIRMIRMMVVICLLVAAIQMYIHSGNNASGYESMLHGFTIFLRRENIGIFSAFLGMLGGFSAGSATVANLMFGQVQWSIAETLGVSTLIIIALQVFGATAGNAVSLANISAIEGVVGIKHRSRDILAQLMLPISLYFCALILLGATVAIFL